jgi:hypothetical protein
MSEREIGRYGRVRTPRHGPPPVHWDDDRWNKQWHRAADHAHVRFGAADVAEAMFDEWREVLGFPPASVRRRG